MGISNNPTKALTKVPAEVTGSKSLADLKLPEVAVNALNKAEKYISEKPGVVAAVLGVAAIGNALKYAAKTAPERAEMAQLDKIKAEEAQVKAELDRDARKAEELRIHNFLNPPNKETV